MTGSSTTPVRGAAAADLVSIRNLLVGAALPVEDIEESAGIRFWIAKDGSRVVGAIGLQPFGQTGLLRSLVVAPSHRNRGLGSSLVTTLEQEAISHAVQNLVLLTQTAEAFFRERGYEVVERADLPDPIQQSAEFRSLCPASAVCMTKSFD
jgi:amino-acid N-acetyltransferase